MSSHDELNKAVKAALVGQAEDLRNITEERDALRRQVDQLALNITELTGVAACLRQANEDLRERLGKYPNENLIW